jgi:DNA-binding MarR family transcriptional regulator
MRMVSNAVSQEFARKVMVEGVTVAEWSFLRVLYEEEGIAPTALADRMSMTRGAISKLADRLESKGLIMRSEVDTDLRGQTLSLTPEGRAKVPTLAGLADANDAEYFGVLTGEEHGALDRILKALVERRGLSITPVE